MSVAELKERQAAATVNNLKDRLRQRRQQLLDTAGFWVVAGYARSQGKSQVTFGSTDLVSCRTLQGHTGRVYSLDWTTERNRIGWKPTSVISLSAHKGYVSCCQYVPDEDIHIITSSGDQTCVLWDITTGLRTSFFGGEFQSGYTGDVLSGSINGLSLRMFVSGSCDATARLWDTRVASRAVQGDVNSVKFFADGNRFGTGSDDETCRLFDIRTGHQLQVYYQQHGDNEVLHVTSIAFSVSGRLLFAGYSNGDCYVWDTLLAKIVLNLGSVQNLHESLISCLGLSADGSAICTGSWDTNLKIWAFGGHRTVI